MLLLLADNCILQLRTKPQKRTDLTKDAQKRFVAVSSLAILAGYRQPQGRALRRSCPGCCSWPSHVGRAIRDCGDVARAGWIAWRVPPVHAATV